MGAEEEAASAPASESGDRASADGDRPGTSTGEEVGTTDGEASARSPRGGMFRGLLEDSFPELYVPPREPTPVPGEGEDGEEGEPGDDGDAAPREEAEADAPAEDAEGEGEGEDAEPEPEPEPDEYQLRIAEIENQATSKIENLDELERYLDDARADADAAEEAALHEADALYTRDHRRANLPRAPLTMKTDPTIVAGAGLLDANALMAENAERIARATEPPKTAEFMNTSLPPGYAEPTENKMVRDRTYFAERPPKKFEPRSIPGGPPVTEEEFKAKIDAANERRRRQAKKMTPGQLDLENKVLDAMRRRMDYLRNPRHPEPKFDYLRNKLRPEEGDAALAAVRPEPTNPSDVFVVEPAIVEFNDFDIGAVYEVQVSIRNKTNISRRLRLLPPPSSYFSVTELVFPHQHGMLAPGLKCNFTVRFSPDSLADYEDALTVLAESFKFTVELAARRHPPCLTLDATIDVGHVLVGNDVEVRLPFKNVGGAGRFRLVAEEDWPDRATPLVHAPDDVYMDDGEEYDDPPIDCIEVHPFRVGPAALDMKPLDVERLRVGFRPPDGGDFLHEFRMICDNCQVKSFTIVGRGTILDVAVTELDGRDVIEGELSRPVWFGDAVPGIFLTREITVRNATTVPIPFNWNHPKEEGVFVIEPTLGVFPPSSEMKFTVTFTPADVEYYERDVTLMVDTSYPARMPEPGWPFEAAVAVESFKLAGVGAAKDVSLDTNLVNFAGSLLPTKTYDREVTVTNNSAAAVEFTWAGHDDECLIYPDYGALEPNGGKLVCVVKLTAPEVSRVDRTLLCSVQHGPTLPLRVQADVEGAEVVIAQREIDFGLLQRDIPGDTYVLLRNTSSVVAYWTLEERRGDGLACEMRFSVTDGMLPPYSEVEVECTLAASEAGAYRSTVVCVTDHGATSAVGARADVLRPRATLSEVEIDLGVVYLGVQVEREVTIQNMTMLPAVFRWSEEIMCEGPSDDAEGAMDYEVDWPADEIPPGGAKTVRVVFTPMSACADYSALFVCDVDGAEKPIGFALAADVRGLSVEYDVLKRGVVVAGDGEKVAATSIMRDQVVVDFGDQCVVREHSTMEVCIRNDTAMEANVIFACDRYGVNDATALNVLEAKAAATAGDSEGFAKGGVARAGTRTVGGLAGGSGMLAHAMARTTVTAETKFSTTVFGAASTAGPDASHAALRKRDPIPGSTFDAKENRGGHGIGFGRLPNGAGAATGKKDSFGTSRVSFASASATNREMRRRKSRDGDALSSSIRSNYESESRVSKTSRKAAPVVSARDRPVTLTSAHESVKFSRGLGVQMDNNRRSEAADAAALATGDGAAFIVFPSRGVLPPYGEFRARVVVVSDMPGEYFDALRCRVWNRYDELPERALPVRAGITGSPLIVQPTKIVPAGYAPTAPRPPKLKVFALDWGEKETGAPAVSKRFYCVNKGPHDMTVNFEAWLSPPDPDLNGVTCALTKLIVDEDAEFVSVDILGQGEKCGEKGPFTVVPSGDVVVPKLGGQRQFEVTYSYRGKPRKFVGAVVGTHSVRGPGANANRGLKLELGCAATKNRVGDVDADAPERDAAARRAVAKPVRVRINDAFHFTSAGPPMQMKPLLVRMQATAFSPRLTVDERENFRWRCYSPVDVSDGSYYKSVTLTNAWAKPLGFKMSIGGPFEITDVVSSVPQLAFDRETSFVACARARAAAKVSKPPPKISDVDFVLPAEENVHVTMRFVPPEPDEDDFGNPIHDDATLDGGLVLDYDNGTRDVQTFKLLCEYLHPALEVNVQEIDFGKVHCAAKTLSARRLTLTNTGEADAEWAMHFPRWMHRVGMAGSVFECVPASGIIPGTGPHGKPRSVEIEILLDAKKPERYASALTFKPRLGRGCSVVVQGEGTLDEEYEGQIMPRFEPIDDA